MQKIIISHLTIGGEKIPAPVGLSELLESTWSLDVNTERIDKIANQYEFVDYKNEHQLWVTKCVRKKVKANENQSSRVADITD